jgi:hypothetical protein
MTSAWQQVKIVLWKNTLLKRRHYLSTLLEILIPLVLFAINIAVRPSLPSPVPSMWFDS